MEFVRDIDRVMEWEIARGSCPLRFVKTGFSDSPYQGVASRGKLLGVLSHLSRTDDYGRFAGKETGNSIYVDMKGREAAFKRARSFINRSNMFSAIRRHGREIKPDFDGHTYLKIAQCCFELPEREREKYQVMYNGQETFVLPMLNEYIPGLYTHYISARRVVPEDVSIPSAGFSEKERDVVGLEGVRGVLSQCLSFDTIKYGEGMLYANLYTIYCLK